MNIQTKPPRTPAEQQMLDAFSERLGRLPGDQQVAMARDAAIEALKTVGLPTRRIEAWHYTDLKRLLTAFPQGATALTDGSAASHAADYRRLVEANRLPLFNGRFHGELADPMPQGVSVQALASALESGAATVSANGVGDTIGDLNTAFVTDGVLLDIAEGAQVLQPIGLAHVTTGDTSVSSAVRHQIAVGAGAKATIIERHVSAGSIGHLTNAVSTITLGDGAVLDWYVIQETNANASHFSQFHATLGENAKLRLFIFNAGGKLVREEVIVKVAGTGGDFQMRAINLLAGSSHTDITMVLDHAAEHTTSTEIIRNVATDHSHGVFQGQIKVHKTAQKTDARMACNTLVLSDDADFSAKPELEIFADDVACGHGATVTEIDAKHLFYLMARGIPEKTARGMLVQAFVAELIDEIEDEAMNAALHQVLENWFDAHG
jgi:Fe-S cluster assembly protein SufD